MTEVISISGKFGIMHNMFKAMFPDIDKKVSRWGRYDQASIFIETTEHMTYIFSYKNERDWCFQTMTNYKNTLGRKK